MIFLAINNSSWLLTLYQSQFATHCLLSEVM